MYPFKRILIPTDFSLCAEAALRHALFLAQRYKAEVHLLHVTPPPRNHGSQAQQERQVVWPDKVTEPRPGMPAYTEHWHDLLLHRVLIHHNDPVAVILSYAEEHAIDFIVMGAHGDWGTGHYLNLGVGSAFLGHTAEQVVRHAHCPVFRVAMRKGRSPELIRRVLVPVDFSPLSLLALSYAKDLAALYDARLALLHVLEPHATSPVDVKAGGEAAPPPTSQKQARQELINVFKRTKGREVSASFHVVLGRPDRKIRAFVLDKAVDMVVIGAHSELGQDVLGIVAEQIVRKAPCPVLTVRKGQVDPNSSARTRFSTGVPSVYFL